MNMRFALITDIHGNMPALKAALHEIDTLHDVDSIYCLGDMIGIGPDTNEVLHALFSRDDISFVSGNHDEAVLAIINGEPYPESHFHSERHHKWIADRMDKSFVPLLERMPRMIRTEAYGKSMLFTHYHIARDKFSDPISKDPFSPIVEPSLSNLEKLFDGYEDALIGFGHHHPVHYFRSERQAFVNPGSLGCNNKSTARYAIVTVCEQGFEVQLQEAEYDNSAFLASYEKLDVPDREFILRVFHGDQLRE
ncbi:metallophosphoesterase family protein [Paenibacillus sp. JDR-2]|uniref:metallophosphoesterase family protein n=1 Tax=Paenibacillus sp. (strain JDR-2) TaxID=324057 RepID=UPI0001667C10|nr:metallophosphoesterase family protein [Paenibacillus sp. JDR-2]ACT01336.1 metallophosphoesterase [Paenibacillus sp. JDR-2]